MFFVVFSICFIQVYQANPVTNSNSPDLLDLLKRVLQAREEVKSGAGENRMKKSLDKLDQEFAGKGWGNSLGRSAPAWSFMGTF